MVPCSLCGASLERRVTKSTGRVFYGCTNYFASGCKGFMEEADHRATSKARSGERRKIFLKSLLRSEAEPYPKPMPASGEPVPTRDFEYEIGLNQDGIGVDFFNPPQAYIVRNKLHRKRCNLIITTPTSSGKTAMAEMIIARQMATGRKAVYVSPLKAVTSEKYSEWTADAHPFSARRIIIMTGDYKLTPKRMEELASADIVLMTSEMLDSRSRKADGEKGDWISGVGAIVVDEAHLLGTDRGPALEAGLMRFSEMCPARIVFLSATMPNITEIQAWLTTLNGMPTVTVDLPWRPVELRMHWLPYEHSSSSRVRDERFDAVREIVRRHRRDGGTLVFVHTKRMGREIQEMLSRMGISCEFHSGELGKEKRQEIEAKFRNRELPVLISTSTLAWGCNL